MFLQASTDGKESKDEKLNQQLEHQQDNSCIDWRTATPIDARWVSLTGFIFPGKIQLSIVYR